MKKELLSGGSFCVVQDGFNWNYTLSMIYSDISIQIPSLKFQVQNFNTMFFKAFKINVFFLEILGLRFGFWSFF